jgi:WD40 repeat protein
VAFSPDEKLFASTDRSGLTTLWNIQQRKTVGRFQGPSERAYVPVFSPDSKLMSVVYSNGKGTLFSLDAIDERFIRTAEPAATIDSVWGEVVAIRFSPSGSQLVVRYAGGKLAFWDTGRWLPQHRLPMHFDPRYREGRPEGLADISVAADGSVIGIESAGQWRGWNTESGSEVAQKTGTILPLTAASPSEMGERSLRIIGQEAGLLDRKLGRTLRLAHNDDVTSAAFSPDGSCVVTTSGVKRASGGPREGGNVARLWDAETGALLREWWFPDPPDAAFFAGVQRVVVLHGGQALVYQTSLCQAGELLIELARARAAINTDSTLTPD